MKNIALMSTDLPQHTPKVLTADQISQLCFNATGGGWTEEQTAEAMELQRRAYQAEIGETIKLPSYGSFYFVIVDDDSDKDQIFVVETAFANGWENCWSDEDGKPMTFKTIPEAQEEINDTTDSILEAISRGDMTDTVSKLLSSYRIVEAPCQ